MFIVKQFIEGVSRETMTLSTKQLGNLGEKIAGKYLKKQGYKILERNFKYKGYGEIDIITMKDENLYFIEVKTRLCLAVARSGEAEARETSNNNPYRPEDNITYFKQKQLIKLSKIYLAKHQLNNIPWQIDIIAIEINPLTKEKKIRHIEQAVMDFN